MRPDEIIIPAEIENGFITLINAVNRFSDKKVDPDKAGRKFHSEVKSARTFYQALARHNNRKNASKWLQNANKLLPVNSEINFNEQYLSLIILFALKRFDIINNFDELLLSKPITRTFEKISPSFNSFPKIELIKVLLLYCKLVKKYSKIDRDSKEKKFLNKKKKKNEAVVENRFENEKPEHLEWILKELFGENIVHNFLHVNEFEGITYYNKERFEELLKWILLFNLLETNLQISKNVFTNIENKENRITVKEYEKYFLKYLKVTSGIFLTLIDSADSTRYDLNKFKNEMTRDSEMLISKDNKKKYSESGRTAQKSKTKKSGQNNKRRQ